MKGNSGMGMHKHGTVGRAGKSPKMRMDMKIRAEKQDRKAKKHKMSGSVAELFHGKSSPD